MQSYVELTQIKDDPRFGDIHIMYNPQNPLKRVMRKVNKCQNLQDFEASKKQVQTRKQIDHPNILCLVDNEFNESQMKTSVYFDYPEEMIDLGNLKPIDSVYLLKDILSAILYLQSKRMIHGDIRPEYISYDKLRKNYVLLDRLQDISSPLQTQLNNIKNYKSLYMSPIVFNELMKKTKKIKQNSYKSELFSLGMLCLSIFESSDKVQSFYSSKNKRFDKYAFQELLQNMQKRNYDPVIKEFTDFLTTYVLVYNESKRLNPRNVHEKIIQYKNLSMVFQDQQDEEKEIDQSIETIKDIRKKESLTSTMTDMSYYNPFDFVEVEQEMFQSDNNPEVTDNEPFFDNNKQMRISEKITIDIDAKKQNILVVTQDQFLLDEKDMQRKKQPQIVNDQGKKPLFNKTNSDKLNQLKYFKLKLQINSEPVPNKVTKEKPIRVSTKVIREPQENLEHQIQQIKINQDKKETKQLEQDYILQKVVQKEIQQQKVERRLSEVFSRDDNESISSKPLDSKNSEVRQEGKDYTDYLESLGITIKEEDQEFPNNNLTLAQRLSSLKELEMCIKDEGALIQQQNEMDKSPSNAKKNLKQFLRSTSYKPRDTIQTQEDLNDTSNSRTGQEKKVVQSFNIINPQNKQKKHRRDNNKVITANYQLMNLNNKKEIGENLKNKIKEYKKGVTSDRFFFNINRKQSQSPQPRSDNNIIQFENAKRAKSHNMRGPNTQNQFSSRLDYLENSQQKTLTMKVDKLEQCQETQQNLDEKFINEALPLKKDKEGKNIPSDTILKNIEEKLLLKKYKLQEQNSIYSYQQNQARVSINSTNFYETDSIQQGYKKKNIKYSYKLDNRFSSTRENNYFANREQYEQPQIIQNQYLETNDKNNDQNQKIDTASQIKKMYYQTEPRKNSLFVQEKQPNIIKTSIKQDNIDYGNVVNKFEELKNQIIYRDQKKHQNGSSQNSLNITPNQSQMYHKYVPKYSVSRQDQVPRRVVNDKQYNNSIEYTKIRDTSQYKQPRIVSNKYLDFADTNSNHMRNTVNMGSNFHNQVRQQQQLTRFLDQNGNHYYKYTQLNQKILFMYFYKNNFKNYQFFQRKSLNQQL